MRQLINRAVVVTRDRPAMLRRHLQSIAEQCAPRSEPFEVVVFDDSNGPGAEAVRGVAEKMASSGMRITIVDRAGREALARDVATVCDGPDRDVVYRAIAGGAGTRTGASRNAARLFLDDRPTLWCDDDIVLRPAPAPSADRSCATAVDGDPTEFWFFDRADEAAAASAPQAIDPRVLLEEAIDPMNAPDRRRPLLASFGLAGDSGMTSPLFALAAAGPTRRRLVDPRAYRLATTTRAVIRCARIRSHTRRPVFMAFAFASQTMRDLPPFPSHGRNQDSVFAAAAMQIHLATSIVHLPWVVPHLPPEPRRFEPGADPMPLRPNDVLFLLVRAFDSPLADPAQRWLALAEHLRRAADVSPEVLALRLEALHGRARVALLRHLDRMRSALPTCPGWRTDADAVRRRGPRKVGAAEADVLAHHVTDYAALLRVWPKLRGLAAE